MHLFQQENQTVATPTVVIEPAYLKNSYPNQFFNVESICNFPVQLVFYS